MRAHLRRRVSSLVTLLGLVVTVSGCGRPEPAAPGTTMPGVNAPGDHDRDYGADPWKWIMAEWARIQNGTYDRYVENYQLQRSVAPRGAPPDPGQ